jgi:hypothetical protein
MASSAFSDVYQHPTTSQYNIHPNLRLGLLNFGCRFNFRDGLSSGILENIEESHAQISQIKNDSMDVVGKPP